jgi:hypothetical protein
MVSGCMDISIAHDILLSRALYYRQMQSTSQTNLEQLSAVFERFTHTFFSPRSLITLAIAIVAALVLGRFIGYLLRRIVSAMSVRIDKTENLQTVNRLRRYETLIILSIAIIRTFLLLAALYLWWVTVRPAQQPTAIIGASAVLAIILGGALGPVLRDIATGSVMMAEQWYAVGDHVRIEPFTDMQGVVERVTLRSTRIRGLSGEVIWINNQNIQAVRITPKGIRTLAIELFVSDPEAGERLIESTNRRLPAGELLVISPLAIMTSGKVGDNLWHITAIAETAPGREWLIERYAIEVMTEINDMRGLKVLATDPVARYADSEAERRFATTIVNSRKSLRRRRGIHDLGDLRDHVPVRHSHGKSDADK